MRRCIENAIAAGYITRSAGDDLNSRLNDMLRDGLAPPDIKQRLSIEMAAKAKQAKLRALLMEARRRDLSERVLNYHNAAGEIDPAEALWLLVENDARGAMPSIWRLEEAIRSEAHADMRQVLHEFRKGFFTGDLRRRQKAVRANMDQMVRELFGEDTGNPHAKALAKAFSDVAERLRQRANRAGMNIQKIDLWGLPQGHDPAQLLAVGQMPWVEYMMQEGVLKRSAMIDHETGRVLSDDELREALKEVWVKITTDGWIMREPSYAAYGKGALARQADDKHRFLHFASADAWLAYHRAFKAGDPFESMMTHISMMARDIATLEILGPSPEIMRNYLKQLVLQHAANAEPMGRIIADRMATVADSMRRLAPGDAGERLLGDMTAAMHRLADAEAKAGAKLANGDVVANAAVLVETEIAGIMARLNDLEPEAIGARRAELIDLLLANEGERAAIGGKAAPQLGGLSKRNKRRLEALAKDRTRLEDELQRLDTDDKSLFVAEPEAYAEIVRATGEMKDAAGRLRAGGLNFAEGDLRDRANRAIARHDAMWDVVRGTHFAPVNKVAADTLQAVRNLNTAVLLGSAIITAVPGDITMQRFARKMMGIDHSLLNVMAAYITMFSKERRALAVESMLGLDAAVHVMHQNARTGDGLTGIGSVTGATWGEKAVAGTGFAADRVISASGLAAFTQWGKWGFGLDFMSDMAAKAKTDWKGLTPELRRTLENNGFDAAAWDTLRATPAHRLDGWWEKGGDGWLRPNEVAQGPGGQALAEKYLMMIHTMTRHAVLEGTVRTRSMIDFGRPGTFGGELGRAAFQFKSFGLAAVTMQIGNILRTFQRGERTRGVAQAAEFLVTTTIAGALALELYEVVTGRDPVLPGKLAKGEVPDAGYWVKAAMKGGGLGIYGDFALAPVGQAGQGLVSTLAGPTVGQIDRLRGASFGEVIDWWEDGDEAAARKQGKGVRRALEASRVVTPGGSLWFARLLKERLVLNQLQKHFDPNYEKTFRQHEKLQKKRLGNDYWWRAGDLFPKRGPDF